MNKKILLRLYIAANAITNLCEASITHNGPQALYEYPSKGTFAGFAYVRVLQWPSSLLFM